MQRWEYWKHCESDVLDICSFVAANVGETTDQINLVKVGDNDIELPALRARVAGQYEDNRCKVCLGRELLTLSCFQPTPVRIAVISVAIVLICVKY